MTKIDPTMKYYKSLMNFNKRVEEENDILKEKIKLKKLGHKEEKEEEEERWDTWNIRGPKNTRIIARNKLTFSNTDAKFFKKHIEKTKELAKNYEYKLRKKLNIYKIPKGVYPKFQHISQFYYINDEEYSDCWEVISYF